MPDPVGSVMYGAYHGDGQPVASGVLAAGKYAVEGVGKDSRPRDDELRRGGRDALRHR